MKLFGKRNEAVFDEWSLVHISCGIFFAQSGLLSFPQVVVAHTLFEVIESSKEGIDLFQKLGWERYVGDTLANSIGDTIAAIGGYLLGVKLK